MKEYIRRLSVILLVYALLFGQIGVCPVQAANKAPKKLTLSVSKITMYVGQKATLSVKKVTPKNASKKVAFTSLNKSIATVNSKGIITAKKDGTVKIKVTSKENPKVKAYCKVTVYKKVTEIALSKRQLTMIKGTSYQLKVTKIKPDNSDKKVSFQSSNKKVVQVSNSGKLLAVGPGYGKITVKSSSNSKVKAICHVIVVEPTATPTVTVSATPTVTPRPTVRPTTPPTPIPTARPTMAVSPAEPSITPLPTGGLDGVLYSGTYGDTSWFIDKEYVLTVQGTGDMWSRGDAPGFAKHKDKIKKAVVQVQGATHAEGSKPKVPPVITTLPSPRIPAV